MGSAVEHRRDAERGGEHDGNAERPPDHRQAPVALLKAGSKVEGEAVGDESDEDHPDRTEGTGALTEAGEGDQDGAEDTDGEADDDPPGGDPSGDRHGDDRDEDRRRPVEHPGQGGGHVLLGEGEHAQREGHPDHPEHGDAPVVGAPHGTASGGEYGEGDEPEQDAQERDAHRVEGLQPLGDEQERRSPDHPGEEERHPPDEPSVCVYGPLLVPCRHPPYVAPPAARTQHATASPPPTRAAFGVEPHRRAIVGHKRRAARPQRGAGRTNNIRPRTRPK